MNKYNHVIIDSENAIKIDRQLSINHNLDKISFIKITTNSFLRRTQDYIKRIIETCKKHGLTVYVGGGVVEEYLTSSNVSKSLFELVKMLHSFEIDTIEFSNSEGTMEGDLSINARKINILAKDFENIIFEIGDKNPGSLSYNSIEKWYRELDFALKYDNAKIILEGGGNGNVGIYNYSRIADVILVGLLIKRLGIDNLEKIIIEAPFDSQQEFWISLLGQNIGLGNIDISTIAHNKNNSARKIAENDGKTKQIQDFYMSKVEEVAKLGLLRKNEYLINSIRNSIFEVFGSRL